ncbi:N-acetyltransferase [Saccharobesus litoralis]|uniref:N-acetyltransferase n=1 Tax=Saccharobesus litoralis TaxID=2172099 RepID=A0A2S0VRH8_9ALTE|nr:GNAT family N-acetyltransferase [Saccharobesus litoralis]AWB66818.1 N-acetyltransferase [Saccharobesus litoralis]
MTTSLQYLPLEPVKLPLVNKFYRANNGRGSAIKSDLIWVARKHNDIVGTLRFSAQQDAWLLTGVLVSELYQGQGIGTHLLGSALNKLDQFGAKPVYTFPYQHLVPWYQKLGFCCVEVENLPSLLLAKLTAYRRQGRNISAMEYKRDGYKT